MTRLRIIGLMCHVYIHIDANIHTYMIGKCSPNTFAFNNFVIQLNSHLFEVFDGAAALVGLCVCWSIFLLSFNKRCGTLWVGPMCASDNANKEQ